MFENDRDSFWDIEKLIPKKKAPTLSPFATKPAVVDYSVAAPTSDNTEKKREERQLTFTGMRMEDGEAETTYFPENTLIKSVGHKICAYTLNFMSSRNTLGK